MHLDDFRYIHRGIHLQYLQHSEAALLQAVHKTGKKKDNALLMLHGFSSTPAVYRNLLPKLKHYDAIYCPILPGHADSINAFTTVSAKSWLEEANKVCAQLISEYQHVDVLGLSLGGVLGCMLSEKQAINHLYLLAPALHLRLPISRTLALTKLCKKLGFSYIRNAAGNILSTEHAEISYRLVPLNAIIEILQLIHNLQWKEPTCSISLFLGRHDQVVNSEKVERLFQSNPKATIHWLENSAHVLPLDNDVLQMAELINNKSRPG